MAVAISADEGDWSSGLGEPELLVELVCFLMVLISTNSSRESAPSPSRSCLAMARSIQSRSAMEKNIVQDHRDPRGKCMLSHGNYQFSAEARQMDLS